MLHTTTLFVVQISITLLVTALLVAVAMATDALQEQRLWALGNTVTCLGLAIGVTTTLPLWVHGAVSYSVMALGLALVMRGLRQFCGKDFSDAKVAAISVLGLLLPLYFCLVQDSLQARLQITGLYFGSLNVWCAWILWHDLRDEARQVMWPSLAGFAALALSLFVRAGYLSTHTGMTGEYAIDTVFNFTLLAITLAQVSTGFGLIVMVAHRYALRLNRLSMLDGLTGAYNRGALERLALRTLNRARQSNRSVAVAMVDADHFKAINDRYGHPTGDAVLRHLVATINLQLRPADLVVRYGGEEFALVLDGLGSAAALAVAQRLCDLIAQTPVEVEGESLRYAVSIGVSSTDTHGYDLLGLIAAADANLYQAKQAGRNRVCSG